MKMGTMFSRFACAALGLQLFAGASAMLMAQTPFLGRGAEEEGNFTEKAIADFAATGGNLVRIQSQNVPLRDMEPPYAISEQGFALLDQQLDLCKKYKLNCIIDPQKMPGLGAPRRPDDGMWTENQFGDMAVDLWSKIAEHFGSRGSEVAAYDLMNEPVLPPKGRKNSPSDWNHLVERMIAAIRAKDKVHPIIIEAPVVVQPPRGIIVTRASSFSDYFTAPPESNVIYSLHMYEPMQLTMNRAGDESYPGSFKGKRWDAREIADYFAPVANFQKKYHVQILLGEFSCVRWGGDACNRWVKDVIDYAEDHHWSWVYHSWRGADIWDAEKSNTDQNDKKRYPSTPRLELLKSYWKKGAQE